MLSCISWRLFCPPSRRLRLTPPRRARGSDSLPSYAVIRKCSTPNWWSFCRRVFPVRIHVTLATNHRGVPLLRRKMAAHGGWRVTVLTTYDGQRLYTGLRILSLAKIEPVENGSIDLFPCPPVFRAFPHPYVVINWLVTLLNIMKLTSLRLVPPSHSPLGRLLLWGKIVSDAHQLSYSWHRIPRQLFCYLRPLAR